MRTIALLILAAGAVGAEAFTPEDRAALVAHLEKSRKAFLASFAGLSDAQLRFKPASDRWSVLEVAEHVALTEPLLFGYAAKLLKQAPDPAVKSSGKAGDEKLLARLADRTQRAEAPEGARPSGKFAGSAEVAQAFNQERDKTVEFVRTTAEDLRAHVTKTGSDAYQYLLMLAAHAERHTRQIEEVKADSRFPRQ